METHRKAVVLLTCVAITSVGCNGGTLVEKLPPQEAAARPQWDEPPVVSPDPAEQPGVVEIHLDVSYPMGGFLPPAPREDSPSTLRDIVQSVSAHMLRVYGGVDLPVQWRGIGDEIRDLPQPPRIQRDLFDGRSTRLDLSIASILSDLRAGRTEAAALVTDLMATGAVTGPLVVSGQLSEWLRSEAVRSGVFHVSLFGVKAEYWGVTHPEQCPSGPRLGCWYDEQSQVYRRLESIARVPLYVLVLGRDDKAIKSVMESLQRGIEEMDDDLESQWELVTRKSIPFETALSCKVGVRGEDGKRERQYALYGDTNGQHSCGRNGTVTLFCDFDSSGGSLRPTQGLPIWSNTATGDSDAAVPDDTSENGSVQATGSLAAVRVIDVGLEVDVDCSAIRSRDGALELGFEVTGSANPHDRGIDWSGWSTERASLGKTLNLHGFVQTVRIAPDRYRVELPTVLRFPETRCRTIFCWPW